MADEHTRHRSSTGDPGEPLRRHLLPAADLLAAQLPAVGGRRVLDIGTGTGAIPRRLAIAGWSATGLDLRLPPLRIAAANDTTDCVAGDACGLPFHSASFDAVTSNFGIIFASPIAEALLEARRVCRTGGSLALTAWKGNGWPDALRTVFANALDTPVDPMPWALGDELVAQHLLDHSRWQMGAFEEHELVWDFVDLDVAIETLTTTAGGLRALRSAAEQRGVWHDIRPTIGAGILALSTARSGEKRVELRDEYSLVRATARAD